jgi:OmpA-OmpF porin, OOP family
MYFSSDGFYGIGGLDVFKTTRLNDSSWTEWSEPFNLGKDINTSGFDIAYKITTDGKMAYFSSNMPGGFGGYDIYCVNLPQEAKPEKNVVTIKGKVTDEIMNPLDAEVKWLDINSGNNVGLLKSDPVTGDYIITLPVGKTYSYFADKNGYYSSSNEINLTDVIDYREMNVDIILYSIQNLIEVKKTIRINNIYFDFDKFELKSESFPELDRLISFLQNNPSLKIDIMAHTDSKGTEEYNLILSQNRANSVVFYLIEKGIDRNRLVATGYGESMPVSDNETEEGRAQNRRVEMKLHY